MGQNGRGSGPATHAMRVLMHDYSGHPFQVQLSRELARRGHEVAHWHCSSYATGKGALARTPFDPPTFSVSALSMGSQFQRYAPGRRVLQEIAYGRMLGRRLRRLRPDVAVFCNTPLLAHAVAADTCARAGIPMVFWQQDVYSAAIAHVAAQRLGVAGQPFALTAAGLERRVARQSAAIVAITDHFMPTLRRWGVAERSTVIPNWAPLPELPVRPRSNEWARAHGLVGRPVVLYAGTLGLKHNPALFMNMAAALRRSVPRARLVVASEGRGREWLDAEMARTGANNILLLDYQPYESLPDMLAAADVLLAILEPGAGRYSVPSKVLTYLCAKRPIVSVLPPENAAAATLRASHGAVLVAPGDECGATEAVVALLQNARTRRMFGNAARRYAETTFDIEARAAEFEDVLHRASAAPVAAQPSKAA
ncbi:MAG: glycosyltransferase family 4 protein [Candidatus Dormibacteraeota bacterium]|nr:glycosyltransferase family 4 protein [Candidatus Dormibacteraeota bacterium]